MSKCSLFIPAIESLRDFFYASDFSELMSAYLEVSSLFNENTKDSVDWHCVEYDFNRLFVGPDSLTAPPFSSAYIGRERKLMGASSLDVRKIYSSLGMQVPNKGALPDDFISYELDALIILLTAKPLNVSALQQLVIYHMIDWIPNFCQTCRSEKETAKPILNMVDLLENIVAELALALIKIGSKGN